MNKEQTKAALRSLNCSQCVHSKKYITENISLCTHDKVQALVSPNKCFCEYEFFRSKDEEV